MRAIIFANGGFTQPPPIEPGDLIIAADGGSRHCLGLGVIPDLVVGDFDSLAADDLRQLQEAGVELARYPAHKDFTDLELALQHARQRGASEVLVLAAMGGRWDQTLANVLLPAGQEFADLTVRLIDGNQEISLIRPGQALEIQGRPGDTLSLISLLGNAQGVSTTGLEYPLNGETLYFGSTRGISNVIQESHVSITLQAGLLLCVVIHHIQ